MESILNTGIGFSTTATNWTLPAGGAMSTSGTNYGFNETFGANSYPTGNLGWSTMDINGDAKPDLVVTSEGNGNYPFGFGVGTNPIWKVYLNTGTGFSTTATNWTLPAGGAKSTSGTNYGFNETFGSNYYPTGNQGWSTMDINGDAKPDLVVTSEGNGNYPFGFGVGTNPIWKVYLNTGTGFSTTATNWTLPAGGAKSTSGTNYGFNETFGSNYYPTGNQGWSTMDINGDAKPDLVVTSEGNGNYPFGFGVGTSPIWKVYLNTGAGFSTTATNWTLPAGGAMSTSGTNYGFNETFGSNYYATGNLGWSTMDINGDAKPDLVVTSQGNGSYPAGFGVGTSPIWKVYLNTSTITSTTNLVEKNSNIKIYPNPTTSNNNTTVEINNWDFNKEMSVIKLYNVTGQEVHQQVLKSTIETLNISLCKGLYFYSVSSSNQNLGNGKLIVE